MARRSKFARKDNNAKELLRQIRKVPGFHVVDVSDLKGIGFDWIVFSPRSKRNHLVELKNPELNWKLEPDEERMSHDWPRDWCIVETLEDLLNLR